MSIKLRIAIACLLTMTALPAFAVYNQEVLVTGGPELASATISFESSDGQSVDVTVDDDDDEGLAVVLAFAGDRGRSGTLVVQTADGRTQRFTLPAATDGRPILVDTRTGRVIADGRGPGPRLGPMLAVLYGYGNSEIGSITSAGVTSTAAGETALFETDDNLDIDAYGVEFTVPMGDNGIRVTGRYIHYSGDDDQRASSTPTLGGGVDNAIVFIRESPNFGTGIFGGPTALDSFSELEIDGDKFGGELSWPCGRIPRMTGTLGIYYQSDDIDQWQVDQFVGVDVGTTRMLEVESDNWIVTVGGTYTYPFNDQLGLNLSAGIIGQYYDADMSVTQTITFFDETEELRKDDDDDDLALGAYAAVGLTWSLGQFAVSPMAFIETGTRTAAVEFPTSGDQVLDGREAELDNDSSTNWAAVLRLSVQF